MFKKFLIPALVLAVSGFGAQASEFDNEIPSAEEIGAPAALIVREDAEGNRSVFRADKLPKKLKSKKARLAFAKKIAADEANLVETPETASEFDSSSGREAWSWGYYPRGGYYYNYWYYSSYSYSYYNYYSYYPTYSYSWSGYRWYYYYY
jgi:hypothetical protein